MQYSEGSKFLKKEAKITMNKVIAECVKRLEDIASRMESQDLDDLYSSGYNEAIFCINDGINDRIDYLQEAYSDDSDDVALYCCKEEITSLLKILKECAEEGYADEFKKGFSDAVDKFIDLIQPTIKWLNNYN